MSTATTRAQQSRQANKAPPSRKINNRPANSAARRAAMADHNRARVGQLAGKRWTDTNDYPAGKTPKPLAASMLSSLAPEISVSTSASSPSGYSLVLCHGSRCGKPTPRMFSARDTVFDTTPELTPSERAARVIRRSSPCSRWAFTMADIGVHDAPISANGGVTPATGPTLRRFVVTRTSPRRLRIAATALALGKATPGWRSMSHPRSLIGPTSASPCGRQR